MSIAARGAERLTATVLAALSGYLLIVFLLGDTVAGAVIGLKIIFLLVAAIWVAARFGGRWLIAHGLISRGMLLNVCLLAAVLLPCCIASDVAVSAYLASVSPETDEGILFSTDSNTAIGEWYPRLYFPTEKNFRLHKPGFDLSGEHYGGFYLPSMLQSPTLVDSVLDRHRVSIHINELGFRETSPIDSCRIFALGDSFTFGWGVTDGATWPDLLENDLGTCVYNLGVHDASPKQELLLLEYLFSRPDRPHSLQHLIWMIYEGNDLEDSYAELGDPNTRGVLTRAVKGTIVGSVRSLAYALRDKSLINRFRTGEVRLTSTARRRQYSSAYKVDGVTLVTPLFHSPRFGYMLLSPPYLQSASQPESYVLHHPNRGELDRVFDRMAHLSDSMHFSVTVALMPSSIRLYAPYFNLIPTPSAEPYFLNYVHRLADAEGFDVLDLLQAFRPYARTELLYFRDDDHLNRRGSELTARMISEHVGKRW